MGAVTVGSITAVDISLVRFAYQMLVRGGLSIEAIVLTYNESDMGGVLQHHEHLLKNVEAAAVRYVLGRWLKVGEAPADT